MTTRIILICVRSLAILAAIGAIIISTSINWLYWLGAGGLAAAAVTLMLDLLKPALLWIAAEAWRPGKKRPRQTGLAIGALMLLMLAVPISLLAATGYKAEQDAKKAAIEQTITDKRSRASAAYNYIRAQLAQIKTRRTPAQVRAALTAEQQAIPARVWKRTSGCTDATIPASINACKGITALRMEMQAAQTRVTLQGELIKAKAELDALPARRPLGVLEGVIARTLTSAGWTIAPDTVQAALYWLVALALELASSLAIPIILIAAPQGEPRKPRKKRGQPTPPSRAQDIPAWLGQIGGWQGSQAALARTAGVSTATISRLKQAGKIGLRAGKIVCL